MAPGRLAGSLPYNRFDMSDFDPATEDFATLTNRHDLHVFVKVITPTDRPVRGNAYLAHGFREVHDTRHMRALTGALVRSGYRVVVWDATNSWGRSGGAEQDATFYYHYEDLEDVVAWSSRQPWYEPRYIMAGFSLGGVVAGTFAASHPRQVERLVLAAPVVSGRALRQRIPGVLRLWWRWRGTVRLPRSGPAAYSWEFIRSSWSFDLLHNATRLTMPLLIVGAGRDWIAPSRLLQRLAKRVHSRDVTVVIVPGAKHGFDEAWEADRLERTVRDWLD